MYRRLNTAHSVKKFVFDRVSAKHHRSCDMDQPICGHPDNHRPVACCHHVHAPEDSSAVNQDHPKIRHVPGRGIGGAATHRPQNNRGDWLRNVCVFSLQLVLVLSQLQSAIINILALNGTIACAPPFSAPARGYSKFTCNRPVFVPRLRP